MRLSPDYQTHVDIKRAAIPLPDFKGLDVLDIGCDHAYWSFLAANRGARSVLGIDRNREVRGVGFVDLVSENRSQALQGGLTHVKFARFDIGKQWPDLGQHDVVMLFSLYHHIFENCGDHKAIWFWLHRQLREGGQLLWENPLDGNDRVVQMNVRPEWHLDYNRVDILDAAHEYFDSEYIGPAMHENTREVWRFTPKKLSTPPITALLNNGAGGATKAFLHEDSRRIKELAHILGFTCHPGSLNMTAASAFDWSRGYYRAELLDVKRRGFGLKTEWAPRWVRLYPVLVDAMQAWAMRFEGEKYPANFVEVIAPERLRDYVGKMQVTLCR